MLKNKRALWTSLVGLLVFLNLVKWAPAFWPRKGSTDGRSAAEGLELDFPSASPERERNVQRDLFALGSLPEGNVRKKAPKKSPVADLAQPLPTPTFVFPDGALREIAGGYRLMGVVTGGSQSQALIGKGDQLFQLGAGEDMGDQYRVDKITDDEVYLTEKQTGNSQRLRIWDDQWTK